MPGHRRGSERIAANPTLQRAPTNPAGPTRLRWTRKEYYEVAAAGLFDGRRVELIRGEIVEMSPQRSPHAGAIAMADELLRRVFKKGFVIRVQMPLEIGKDSDPEPDLAVVRGTAREQARAHPSTAELVIEVAESSLDYDRTTKGSLYAEARIPEYWIVNLIDGVVEVYRNPIREARGVRFSYSSMERVPIGKTIVPLAAPRARVKVRDLIP